MSRITRHAIWKDLWWKMCQVSREPCREREANSVEAKIVKFYDRQSLQASWLINKSILHGKPQTPQIRKYIPIARIHTVIIINLAFFHHMARFKAVLRFLKAKAAWFKSSVRSTRLSILSPRPIASSITSYRHAIYQYYATVRLWYFQAPFVLSWKCLPQGYWRKNPTQLRKYNYHSWLKSSSEITQSIADGMIDFFFGICLGESVLNVIKKFKGNATPWPQLQIIIPKDSSAIHK